MSEIPAIISNSHLWRTTLAQKDNDDFTAERERLRSALTCFRKRAAVLAGEIRKDLSDLTVHDITHLDALWETASVIVGDEYMLTPTEGFVLGGAFLLHDLGMALAAVEGGISALQNDPRWADLVTYEYQTSFGQNPSPEEIRNPKEEVYNRVLLNMLRQIHGENAEKLIFVSFRSGENSDRIHLMDDPELRQIFGRIIGRVAHSHWWSLQEVEKEFERVMGAPHWCPPEWTVDPLKLACVLRCADAAQIDSRRAPMFLKAVSQPSGASKEHWTFQEKLNKPYISEDSLVFTTGQGFRNSEAPSWWLCLETLRMIEREIRSVDSLFADKGYPRFAARRIAGIDSPERLASYIQTDGWLPINATIHVTDLPRVIKSIGGEELYGKRPEVALRELIQNASDAIHARRIYERRPADYGEIKVSITKQGDNAYYLEVSDNGIGMSKTVLTDFLLDFGRAFWGSAEMQREFPSLLSSGIKQIGKYGIGFFAVFMIAEQVQVITRRSDAASKDTLVLEFGSGLKGRPILREANSEEQLIDCGTLIRLKLKNDPFADGGFLYKSFEKKATSLANICVEICPALEVDLVLVENGSSQKIIRGGDWRTLNDFEFLKRMPLLDRYQKLRAEDVSAFRQRAASNVRFLRDENGEIVGRALITTGYAGHFSQRIDLAGVVTVGGLTACSLSGISGVLVGAPMRASRDAARPLVPDDELKRWTEEQADLVPHLWERPKLQAACAEYIRLCGGHTRNLPICVSKGKWWSALEIAARSDLPSEILLLDSFVVEHEFSILDSYKLNDNVFVVDHTGIPGLLQCHVSWPRGINTSFTWGGGHIKDTLAGAVLESIAKAWGVDIKRVIESNDLERDKEKSVGLVGERELKARAITVKRPQK